MYIVFSPRNLNFKSFSTLSCFTYNIDVLFYSIHCNTPQIWSWCTEYSSSVINKYPAIYKISRVGEKNDKIEIISSFSAIKLRFVINLFQESQDNYSVFCSILRKIS